MKNTLMLLLLVLFVGLTHVHAQTPSGRGQGRGQTPSSSVEPPLSVGPPPPLGIQPGKHVVALDPAMDELVSSDAKLELVRDDFGNLEGPNWIQEGTSGYLEFIDMIGNVVYKMTPDGKASVIVDRAGYTGNDPWNVGLDRTNRRDPKDPLYMYYFQFGPDGSSVDENRRIIVAGMFGRSVYRVEKDGKRTVLADKYEGKRFCGPNDVIVKRDGSIYFSDTQMGVTGKGYHGKAECPPHGIYRIKEGKVTLVVEESANGLAFSPDEKILYSVGGGNHLNAHAVLPDGTISKDGRLLIDQSVDKAFGSADGMRVDSKGNVYATGPGGVWITSPEGKHLGTILVPGETPWYAAINLTFGGMDYKTLYIVGRARVYRIPVKTTGNRVFSAKK